MNKGECIMLKDKRNIKHINTPSNILCNADWNESSSKGYSFNF